MQTPLLSFCLSGAGIVPGRIPRGRVTSRHVSMGSFPPPARLLPLVQALFEEESIHPETLRTGGKFSSCSERSPKGKRTRVLLEPNVMPLVAERSAAIVDDQLLTLKYYSAAK